MPTDPIRIADRARDKITGAQNIISTVHHEVHEGETYLASMYDDDIADDAAIEMLLITGEKYAHLTFEAACGGNAELSFFEETTVSDNGANLLCHRMRRYGKGRQTVQPFRGPTITNDNRCLVRRLLAGGRGGNASGGTARQDTEWILKPSTIYLIRLTNRAGTAQSGSIVSQWYEESDAG